MTSSKTRLSPYGLLFLLVAAASCTLLVEAQLSNSYYSASCPRVESLVRGLLSANLFTDPTAPAALARLAFHDCQVQGCDASIMLDSAAGITAELGAAANLGIRRLDFIDRIKAVVEAACPGVVSCADIIALAGRDAINLSGGPHISIPLGRRDGISASSSGAQKALPPATITVDNMLALFGAMGMSTMESVAILGAHTFGIAHCANIVNRLYPTKDPNLGLVKYNALKATCPPKFNSVAFAALDLTNAIFDNQYFKDVMGGRGLLTIDSELLLDTRTSPVVAQFATNRNLFFQAFTSAYVKMTSFNVLTSSQGQVRSNCRRVNVQ